MKLLIAFLLCLYSASASGLELVISYAAGGHTDVMSREIVAHLNKTVKDPVVILNKPGASHNIGYQYFVSCRECLLIASDTIETNTQESYPKNILNVAKPIFYFGSITQTILSSTFSSWDEVLSAKREILVGHGGENSSSYRVAQLVCSEVKCLQVPYKTGASGLIDLYAGRIDLYSVQTMDQSFGNSKPIREVDIKNWWKLYAKDVDEVTLGEIKRSLDALPQEFYKKFHLRRDK